MLLRGLGTQSVRYATFPSVAWPLLCHLHPSWSGWVFSEDFSLVLWGLWLSLGVSWQTEDRCLLMLTLSNSLRLTVCGLALRSVYRYFNFLLTCSVEDLISSCIYFFSLAACGQVFLSDHLVAIHLYDGLRKELISLVSLAVSASFDSKLPLSPLKILTMLVLLVPRGLFRSPNFVQLCLLLWFSLSCLSSCTVVLNILDLLLRLYLSSPTTQREWWIQLD